MFGDIYDWAGELRSVNIQKGEILFCTPERIPPEAAKIIKHMEKANWYIGATLAELVPLIAEAYGDLNVIHPFREGNGRAQRILFELALAAKTAIGFGHPIQSSHMHLQMS